MPASPAAIDLHHASKTYKRRIRALDNVDLHVAHGEIFGLLGPNGAGKSTLVKIIMSVVKPTSVQGSVLGSPVGSKASLRRVGYLPEHHRFPRYLTGRQTLEFFGALSAMPRPQRKRRAAELLDTVGMTARANDRVGAYSKGMMQRIGVAAALINDPQLVILDEPTDGVDPVGRRDIRDVLSRMRSEGRTVFVNSHLLSELEIISDRVAILVAGRVVKQGTINDLTLDRQCIEIETTADLTAALRTFAAAASTARPALTLHANIARLMSTDPADAQPLIDALRAAHLTIRRVQPIRPSLEDLFIEAVGGNSADRDPTPASPGAR